MVFGLYPNMASFWNQIRADFPITKQYVYLDHAAAGPVIPKVKEAIDQYYLESRSAGDVAWPKWLKRRDEARVKAAKFIHADPDEIAFTQSTSHGMNLAAELLAAEGDILTNTSEFPSSTIPWVWRKSRLIWQEPDRGILSLTKMKSLLSPSVKTLLTSYVQYATGFRQDLNEVGKIKSGRMLVVNATQGFGSFPVDVEKWKADFLVTNSYKWLLAGHGGGIFYIRKKWLNRFRPSSAGWRSVERPDALDNRKASLKKKASRYELGSPSLPAIFAVGAAIDYLSQIGIDKIAARILELNQYLRQGLEKMGFEISSPSEEKYRSGIIIFKVREPVLLWKRFAAKKICVSPRGKGIRVAPHFYNNEEDIDKLLTKLKEFRRRGTI